ncbi:MAG: DUF4349 domain-containing protein [Candidatus Limnocylindrales bacterium]
MNRLSAVMVSILATLTILLATACSGAASVPMLSDAGNSANDDRDGSERALADGDGSGEQDSQAPAPADALIIHTGTMDIEVSDLRAAIDQARAIVSGVGGNVAASHENNTEGDHSATVTFRIPAARWDEAIAALRGIGELKAEDTDAEDVTAAVVDLDARIVNLQASEVALQAIMDRAGTITDVLKVQTELTKVRGDIESMTAQRDHLEDQAALGTLSVRFNMPVAAANVASQGWDLGTEIDRSVAALVRIGQGLASLGIWLGIVFLPVAIPVLLIGYVALRLRRRHLARHPAAQTPVAPSV